MKNKMFNYGRREQNSGFSMVEVLISLAIFAILITPIISGIISAINSSGNSKTLQYRNDFAQNVVEYSKNASMSDVLSGSFINGYDGTIDNISIVTTDKAKTLSKYGAYVAAGNVTEENKVQYILKNDDSSLPSETKELDYVSYNVTGKVTLGTASAQRDYVYALEISNQDYVEKEAAEKNNKTQTEAKDLYTDVNNLSSSTVEDLDYTKVALINGTFANYDTAVSNAFYTQKMKILKEHAPNKYNQILQQQQYATILGDDTATRVITIRVYKQNNPDTGDLEYIVACYLRYHDNSTVALEDGTGTLGDYLEDISYIVQATAYSHLPNVYLMYNTCVYNGEFGEEDYIVFDTSELDDSEETNFFVVETAEQYSSDIVDSVTGSTNPDSQEAKDIVDKTTKTDGSGNVNPLYRNETQHGLTRDNVEIFLLRSNTSKPMNVYTNFGATSGNNKKNTKVYCEQVDVVTYASLISSLSSSTGGTLKLSKPNAYSVDNGTIATRINALGSYHPLEDSQDANVGLYTVKFWIEEGSNPEDLLQKIRDSRTSGAEYEPTIQGTKGGDLIE